MAGEHVWAPDAFAEAWLIIRLPARLSGAADEGVRRGQFVGANDLGETLLSSVFSLRHRRLVAPFAAEQIRLDAALAAALDEPARAGFDLALTEARVTALIGLGLAPRDAARRLGVGVGTVRNHLKAAFVKTRATRQAELAALVAMIR